MLKILNDYWRWKMNTEILKNYLESSFFERFITSIIILNAITLGLETAPSFSPEVISLLRLLDKIFLSIFIVELFLKIVIYQKSYFKDAWRIFDLVIVGIAILPAQGPFSVMRALRVLRTLRMISLVPSLKKVVNGLMMAIPGLGAVGIIMGLIFYVSSVMATKLFGHEFETWFGNVGASAYSLFQIMTLESWSMGIVRPVMEKFPYAWLFFLPFILIATFTMLNLFIAVIVSAMQAESVANSQARQEQGHDERMKIVIELKKIRDQLDRLEKKEQKS